MAALALAAPTAYLGGILGAPYVLASGTAITSPGLTCPWVPGLMIVIISGATAAGICTLVNNGPNTFTGPSITVAITTGFGIFGPIPAEYMSVSTGLITINVTTVVTATAFAALLPLPVTAAVHCPMEMNAIAGDF